MPRRILWKGEPAWFVIKPDGVPDGVKIWRAPDVFADRKEAESTTRGKDKIVRGELVLREVADV